MKNTLTDLNNYLFESIERLNDDSLTEEDLEKEIKRSEAIQKVAKTVIENGNLALQVKKQLDEYGKGDNVDLAMIGHSDEQLVEENNELKKTVENLQKRIKKSESW